MRACHHSPYRSERVCTSELALAPHDTQAQHHPSAVRVKLSVAGVQQSGLFDRAESVVSCLQNNSRRRFSTPQVGIFEEGTGGNIKEAVLGGGLLFLCLNGQGCRGMGMADQTAKAATVSEAAMKSAGSRLRRVARAVAQDLSAYRPRVLA